MTEKYKISSYFSDGYVIKRDTYASIKYVARRPRIGLPGETVYKTTGVKYDVVPLDGHWQTTDIAKYLSDNYAKGEYVMIDNRYNFGDKSQRITMVCLGEEVTELNDKDKEHLAKLKELNNLKTIFDSFIKSQLAKQLEADGLKLEAKNGKIEFSFNSQGDYIRFVRKAVMKVITEQCEPFGIIPEVNTQMYRFEYNKVFARYPLIDLKDAIENLDKK